MKLIYMTITGNVRSFVERVGMDSIELNPVNPFIEVDDDYIVIVPSYVGYISADVVDFVEYKGNKDRLIGFVGSGNINFNEDYCFNARELVDIFEKPLIFTFEFSGTDRDIEDFKKEVDNIEVARTK